MTLDIIKSFQDTETEVTHHLGKTANSLLPESTKRNYSNFKETIAAIY